MIEANRSNQLYLEHMEIAKQKFIKKFKREPTQSELVQYYETLMDYFYNYP